jgi:hypothetical protein
MATTKNKIATQVQLLYARFIDKGNESDVIDAREIKLLIEQSINMVLKLQVSESFKAGFVDVPHCNIIEYTCAVTSEPANSRAYFTLPVIPLDLPMSMGLWSVSASNTAMTPYIPIPAQDVLVFQGTNLSYLEGKIGYYTQGKKVYFTKDITLLSNGSISNVVVNILAMDFTQFGDNDMLPISPEVESSIIANTLEQIGVGKVSLNELAGKQKE